MAVTDQRDPIREHTDEDAEETRDWILERVNERVESVPGERQDEQATVWTSKKRLEQDAAKTDVVDSDEIDSLVRHLANHGDLLTWHGLLAPATEDHVKAVVATENRADQPRKILIERCERVLNGGGVVAE